MFSHHIHYHYALYIVHIIYHYYLFVVFCLFVCFCCCCCCNVWPMTMKKTTQVSVDKNVVFLLVFGFQVRQDPPKLCRHVLTTQPLVGLQMGNILGEGTRLLPCPVTRTALSPVALCLLTPPKFFNCRENSTEAPLTWLFRFFRDPSRKTDQRGKHIIFPASKTWPHKG